ncbi:MAG: GumC family protein [Candidatus Muiribacteriota bacterium]
METNEFSLHDYLHTITKRLPIIIEATCIVIFFVMLFSWYQTPVYEADGKILIEKDEFTIEDTRRVMRYEEPIINYIEMMKSEIVRSRLTIKIVHFFETVLKNDMNLSEFKRIYLECFPKNYEFFLQIYSGNGKIDDYFQNELNRIKKEVTLEQIKNLTFYDLEVIMPPGAAILETNIRYRNYVLAEYFIHGIFEIVDKILYQKENEEFDKKRNFINNQIEIVKEEIEKFENKKDKLRIPGNLYNISNGFEKMEEEIRELRLKKEEAKINLGQSRISHNEIKQRLENDDYPQDYAKTSNLSHDSLLGRLRFEYMFIESELETLEDSYGKNHPQIKELYSLKKIVEENIDSEAGSRENAKKINNPFYNNLVEKLVEESVEIVKETSNIISIEKVLNEKEKEYSKYPEINREFMLLNRELKIAENTYNLLLENLNNINIQKASLSNKVTILDRAHGNSKKLKPNYRFNFILGLLAGALTGLTLAFLVEHLDRTIKTPEEAIKLLDLPLFARIPFYEKSQISDTNENSIDNMLISYFEPKNIVTEQFKMLMINSKFGFKGITDKNSTIMVNSAEAGEGKSLVAANLGVTFARAGYKTIIVDVDFRKPEQHKLFGLDNFHGLTDIILGEKKENLIKATDVEKLHLLPSGAIPPSPAMFFETYNFTTLLDNLKEEYDIVIVDSAPSSHISDSLLLVPKVDNILFTIALRHTDRTIVSKTTADIAKIFKGNIGLVCNKVSLKNISGHYYRY